MIVFSEENKQVVRLADANPLSIPKNTVWIDLLNPTSEEEKAVEEFLCIDIPTREEMHEIEVSNRLYYENGAHYMTATMVTKVDTLAPETHAVTFVLTGDVLVTVRYTDATSFHRFIAAAPKLPAGEHDGVSLFLGLFESIVDRMADILERLDAEIDRITKAIFRSGAKDCPKEEKADYQKVLERIGRCGDLSGRIHESFVTYGRVAAYALHHKKMSLPENQVTLDGIRKDIAGLSDHGTYLTGRVQFLLDATLGMISIEQNNIFKILSVASLVFMPPTLIAGIYGMNFKLIPELEWHWGYPMAVVLMIVAGVLPYAYLKQKRML
jgi:magnesium transporter